MHHCFNLHVCKDRNNGIINVPDNKHIRSNCVTVKWNAENTGIIKEYMDAKKLLLSSISNSNISCQDDIDKCVENFCDVINEIVLPHCITGTCVHHRNNNITHRKVVEDKPWFNKKCKEKYLTYKAAVAEFNKCKSSGNLEILMDKKRDYKKLENKLKRQYKRQDGNMLVYMKKHNPSHFYKYFSRRKQNVHNDINLTQFVEHFENLCRGSGDVNDLSQNNNEVRDANVDYAIFEDITEGEIRTAIKMLKRNKSCGEDRIINEIFIECKDALLPHITKLFNNIFKSGYFPKCWAKGCIVPVYKKGDKNDTNNYRGITIISCFCKLFTSVLNARLLEWDINDNIITDAQYGFRPGLSTVDAMFVLQTLINKFLSKKGGRLYCCFVDYKKAFDSIDRNKLWCKLIRQGITGKMFNIIRALYQNIKTCVKYNGFLSNYFGNHNTGLFQGEVLSPIMFSLFMNDCEMHFLKRCCPYIELQLISVFLLMYADDMVLIAESPSGLQQLIDNLYIYNSECNLGLNVDKTKIVVFRNGGKMKDSEKWYYNGKSLDIVNQFNYLGMLFNFNGKFNVTQKHLAQQGKKAYFALCGKLRNHYLNIETKSNLFDIYVSSVLNYGAEIWGFHKGPDIEKIHLLFCKRALGIKKTSNSNMIYNELGRLPMFVRRKLRIFKYWLKIRYTDNCIIKSCYDDRLQNCDTWLCNIKDELRKLGLEYLFDCELYTTNYMYKLIEQRLYDIYKQTLNASIQNCSRGSIYQHLTDNFTLQSYLRKPINDTHLRYITKFRLSAHNLNTETAKYNKNTDNISIKKCKMCNLDDDEDEFHFILKCPKYADLRNLYVKKYFYKKPSVFKLIQLLSSPNTKELRNLGKYIHFALQIRNEAVQ